MDPLAPIRRAFAHRVAALAAGRDPRLVAAFARTPRERFLGPGPWYAHTAEGTRQITDPARLYQDVPIAIDLARGINNGQPSLHAAALAALAPQPGERVLHIGAGTGYYTAILAQLVAPTGRVDAFEIEPDLAARAAANLAEYPQVAVHARSATEPPLPDSDAIYVSAGASLPLPLWLDALRPGGRLLFPLTDAHGTGTMLLLTRPRNSGDDDWPARPLMPVQFIACKGAQARTPTPPHPDRTHSFHRPTLTFSESPPSAPHTAP